MRVQDERTNGLLPQFHWIGLNYHCQQEMHEFFVVKSIPEHRMKSAAWSKRFHMQLESWDCLACHCMFFLLPSVAVAHACMRAAQVNSSSAERPEY
jgi:hypothetical protein